MVAGIEPVKRLLIRPAMPKFLMLPVAIRQNVLVSYGPVPGIYAVF